MRPALELVTGADTLEINEVMRRMVRTYGRVALISWNDVPALWLKIWRDAQVRRTAMLATVQADTFTNEPRPIYLYAVAHFGQSRANAMHESQLRRWWSDVIGTAIAVLLVDSGFTLSVVPGEPFRLARGDQTIELPEVERRLDGKISDAAWKTRCEELGIAGRKLAG